MSLWVFFKTFKDLHGGSTISNKIFKTQCGNKANLISTFAYLLPDIKKVSIPENLTDTRLCLHPFGKYFLIFPDFLEVFETGFNYFLKITSYVHSYCVL